MEGHGDRESADRVPRGPVCRNLLGAMRIGRWAILPVGTGVPLPETLRSASGIHPGGGPAGEATQTGGLTLRPRPQRPPHLHGLTPDGSPRVLRIPPRNVAQHRLRRPAHLSILASLYPSFHKFERGGHVGSIKLDVSEMTLARAANPFLDGDWGFDRGFDLYLRVEAPGDQPCAVYEDQRGAGLASRRGRSTTPASGRRTRSSSMRS
jgi:hypothetical protein